MSHLNTDKLTKLDTIEKILTEGIDALRSHGDMATAKKLAMAKNHLQALREIETIGHVWVPSKDGMTLPKAK